MNEITVQGVNYRGSQSGHSSLIWHVRNDTRRKHLVDLEIVGQLQRSVWMHKRHSINGVAELVLVCHNAVLKVYHSRDFDVAVMK